MSDSACIVSRRSSSPQCEQFQTWLTTRTCCKQPSPVAVRSSMHELGGVGLSCCAGGRPFDRLFSRSDRQETTHEGESFVLISSMLG